MRGRDFPKGGALRRSVLPGLLSSVSMVRSTQRSNSTQDIRRDNRSQVLTLLRQHASLSRVELARLANLTEAAISRIIRELVDVGLVEERELLVDGRRGRPMIGLGLRRKGLFVLGMDIGANAQSVCLADLSGEIITRQDLNLLSFETPEQALACAAETAMQMLRVHGVDLQRLAGVGVGIGGTVDATNRVLLDAPTLGWEKVWVADVMEAAMNVPVWVESRPRAVLRAERTIGIAQGKNNIFLVHPGLGVGVALMVDGNLLRGARNAMGQIAHLKVDPGGQQCICGEHGCLDTVASGYAALSALGMASSAGQPGHARVGNVWLLKQAVAMAHANDHAAIAIFRTAGEWLGRALTTLTPIFDPEVVILAGSIAQIPGYVQGVREKFHTVPSQADVANIHKGRSPQVPMLVSNLPLEQAAVCLALDAFVFAPSLDLERLGCRPGGNSINIS